MAKVWACDFFTVLWNTYANGTELEQMPQLDMAKRILGGDETLANEALANVILGSGLPADQQAFWSRVYKLYPDPGEDRLGRIAS